MSHEIELTLNLTPLKNFLQIHTMEYRPCKTESGQEIMAMRPQKETAQSGILLSLIAALQAVSCPVEWVITPDGSPYILLSLNNWQKLWCELEGIQHTHHTFPDAYSYPSLFKKASLRDPSQDSTPYRTILFKDEHDDHATQTKTPPSRSSACTIL